MSVGFLVLPNCGECLAHTLETNTYGHLQTLLTDRMKVSWVMSDCLSSRRLFKGSDL
jgi:hypothetical protein